MEQTACSSWFFVKGCAGLSLIRAAAHFRRWVYNYMATKEEQIEALLNHKTFELACRELNVTHMARSSYKDVFTVNRHDIDEYVKINGIPKSTYCPKSDPHPCEGIHFFEKNGSWHLYWFERGLVSGEEIFKDYQKAQKRLLDWILEMAGTGIDFTQQTSGADGV